MTQIIGRKQEQQELLEAFSSKNAEFVVVYGRRRVGKTFLIEEFFKKQKCTYFNVIGVQEGLLKEQLEEFAKAIGKTFYKGASIAASSTWMHAFEELTKAIEGLPKNNKVVLFFDELPWMVTRRSRMLQALDYYWNRHWSKYQNLKLVVCGSSASWIIKNIIHHRGGLHNRYTRSILLKPFSLFETKAFLQNKEIKLNDRQILQLYMVLGGIPHYLAQVKRGLSAAQNINYLCFRENGILFSEFDKLFKSLFEDAKTYIELIKIIAQVREGVSRALIEEQSKFSSKGGTLTDRLNDLELAGFIKSFLPTSHQRQGVYYRIVDEYSYFYLRWIEPIKHTLIAQELANNYWTDKAKMPEHLSWMGYAFESVCYKHLTQIRNALNIKASRVGAWRYSPRGGTSESGAQIDLLFERDDGAITICEIKCTEQPFNINKEYYNQLLNKINIYKQVTRTSKQIFIAFISANGIKETVYSNELIDNTITLDNLFQE